MSSEKKQAMRLYFYSLPATRYRLAHTCHLSPQSKYSVRFVLPGTDFVDTFAGGGICHFLKMSDSGNGDCGRGGVPYVERQMFLWLLGSALR